MVSPNIITQKFKLAAPTIFVRFITDGRIQVRNGHHDWSNHAKGAYILSPIAVPFIQAQPTCPTVERAQMSVRQRIASQERNRPMKFSRLAHLFVGLMVTLKEPGARGERGLSQSAENAILIAGAVAVSVAIVAAIRSFVLSRLP
ncbi:MAG: hypothetical protein QM650_18555 [Microlunatus sp.]